MKKIIFFLVIPGFLFTACNSSKKETAMKYTTHREALDTLRKKFLAKTNVSSPAKQEEKLSGIHMSYAKLEEDSALVLLRRIDFGKLMNTIQDDGYGSGIYNGFFGTDHYRIECFVANAKLDSLGAKTITLEGKTRYKKNITPFKGKIVIDSVFEFRDSVVAQYYDDYRDGKIHSFYLTGKFRLEEDESKWGAGSFEGNFYMDVALNAENEPTYWYYSNGEMGNEEGDSTSEAKPMIESRSKTRGAGFLFDGMWTGYKSSSTRPLLLAHDIFIFGNDILQDFAYGEREIEINPKYRDLGWENYWENDEWWNEAAGKKVLMIQW